MHRKAPASAAKPPILKVNLPREMSKLAAVAAAVQTGRADRGLELRRNLAHSIKVEDRFSIASARDRGSLPGARSDERAKPLG
jgi:hypothetical protein